MYQYSERLIDTNFKPYRYRGIATKICYIIPRPYGYDEAQACDSAVLLYSNKIQASASV